MSQKRIGVVQKILCELNVFELLIFRFVDRAVGKLKYLRSGEREQDRRVCGDDELRIFLYHLFERGDKCQLAHGRERGFGFVEQIQAAGDEAGLEESQKRFAMRARVETIAVSALHLRQLTLIRHARQRFGVFGASLVFPFDIVQFFLKFFLRLPHGFGVPEEILRSQEEAFARALRPREAEVLREFAKRREGFVGPHAFASYCDGFGGAGDRFEDG